MFINNCIYKILENLVKSSINYTVGRPLSYSINHYVNVISKVLITGCQWNSLNEKLHYSVYHKHFLKWTNLGIFHELFYIIQKITAKLNLINNNNNNTFIDTTILRNMCGTEDISYNYKIKSKNGTKISIIVNSIGIPLSFHVANSNIHDVSLILPNFNKIDKNIKIKNLIGDKGYISNKIKKYFKEKHDINFIYSEKNNTKNKNTEEENKLMKNRMIVENTFSWITQYRRLSNRYEKYKKNIRKLFIFSM
jgi:transposase